MYLRIAWLYRGIGNSEQEHRFIKLALSEYQETYSTQDYQGTPVTEMRVLYLIGELYVRTGNIRESSKYFSKVIEQQKRTTETRIVEMAKERWNEVRNTVEYRQIKTTKGTIDTYPFISIYELKKEDFLLEIDKYDQQVVQESQLSQPLHLLRHIKNDCTFHNN